ncbi:MAG: DUF551 domain-containing protein [Lachnospiraceae bacterium]|nr:DUF551 domain-containing protein [Lachnospiraceae bacterium]
MSLITEQIKRLKEEADDIRRNIDLDMPIPLSYAQLMEEAAEAINELSAKVHAMNMERSSAHYHNGWIPVDERLPEDDIFVLIQFSGKLPDGKHPTRVPEHTFDIASHWEGVGWYFNGLNTEEEMNRMTVEAWMPLPGSYVPDTDVGKKEGK